MVALPRSEDTLAPSGLRVAPRGEQQSALMVVAHICRCLRARLFASSANS